MSGLPPRGRGREEYHKGAWAARRITPAWAGKSAGRVRGTVGKKDYPRVGGEECLRGRWGRPRTGLPPRGRGRVERMARGGSRYRITPAWAGKSDGAPRPVVKSADYPRVGGEEVRGSCRRPYPLGLPPRGRGRVHAAIRGFAHMGITPAWAGKRGCCYALVRMLEDYPRVGGEEANQVSTVCCVSGLPPRGRGRASDGVEVGAVVGITPAWAGKRYALKGSAEIARDYPRVGGEEILAARLRGCRRGLPPRGRGRGVDLL